MAYTNDETVEALNDVLTEDLNAVRAYQEAVDNVDDSRLSELFEELRQERSGFARDLHERVRALGGEPVKDESISGALKGMWMSLQTSLGDGDADAILDDLESAEESLADAYDDAISRGVDQESKDLLQRQRREVHAAEDRIEKLHMSLKED